MTCLSRYCLLLALWPSLATPLYAQSPARVQRVIVLGQG
jgi:hypothetical protein